MLTRAQNLLQLAAQHEDGEGPEIDSICHIHSPVVLQHELRRCESNPFYATGLQVLLLTFPEANVSLMTICAFLSHAGSADTLKLEIPANTHRWCPPGMFFANLTILHITVEHHALVPFLSTHKAITNLSLGACGCRTSCPLQGIVLPHLAYLVCPPGCVRGLLNNNPVTDLVMKYQSPEDMRFSTSTVVRQGPFLSTVPITRLHADFDPTDSDFLLFLFKIAPDLQILYLRQSVWCYSARVSRPIWRRQVDLFKDLSLLDISINDELAPTKHDEDAYLRTLLPPLPAFILRGRLLNFLRVSTRLREDSWYDRQWNIVDTTWTKTVNHE